MDLQLLGAITATILAVTALTTSIRLLLAELKNWRRATIKPKGDGRAKKDSEDTPNELAG